MSHPHTSVLISQCGVATAHEAILTGTPLLCVPFLFDQFDISVLVKHHHLGDVLPKENLTADALYEMVRDMKDIYLEGGYTKNFDVMGRFAALKPQISDVIDWFETI